MATWVERNNETQVTAKVTEDRERDLNKARDESIPMVTRDQSRKDLTPLEFQPVKSPGIYEGEFAVKDEDLIFHFWPYGYHKAERDGHARPRFRPGFDKWLADVMGSVFSPNRIEIKHDEDVGAWFVRASGYGTNQFHRKLCIKACELLHTALGGKSDS